MLVSYILAQLVYGSLFFFFYYYYFFFFLFFFFILMFVLPRPPPRPAVSFGSIHLPLSCLSSASHLEQSKQNKFKTNFYLLTARVSKQHPRPAASHFVDHFLLLLYQFTGKVGGIHRGFVSWFSMNHSIRNKRRRNGIRCIDLSQLRHRKHFGIHSFIGNS